MNGHVILLQGDAAPLRDGTVDAVVCDPPDHDNPDPPRRPTLDTYWGRFWLTDGLYCAVIARESGQSFTAWHVDPERDRRKYAQWVGRRQRQGTARPADLQDPEVRRAAGAASPAAAAAGNQPMPRPGRVTRQPSDAADGHREPIAETCAQAPQHRVPDASRHQEGTDMPNVATSNHPLTGTEQQYLPAGKVPSPDANTAPSDHKTVARLGDTVTVLEVYENWNGVSGLTVAYVYVHATGYHTHLSTGEMGITGSCGTAALPAGQGTATSPTSTNAAAERAEAPSARTPAPQLAGSSFPVPVQAGSSAPPPGPDPRQARQNPPDQAEARRRSR
jgi:hypothetical protein